MLMIRKEQFDNFLLPDEEKFVQFVVEHIRKNHLVRVSECPENLLEQMIRFGLKRAKSYGFESSGDLIGFVAVMFKTGPNFDEQHEIKSVLEDSQVLPNNKFEQLWRVTSDEAWEQARKNCKAELWFTEETEQIKEYLPKLKQNYSNRK